jgi:hypothetical protein
VDRDLTHRVVAAAMTDEMKAARTSAQAVQHRWHIAQNAAAEALSDDDVRNIRYAMRVPWQEDVLSFPEATVCGLVLFYADGPEWADFKNGHLSRVAYTALLMDDEDDEAIAKFTLHWVAVGETNVDALRSRFQTMRDNREIPASFRSDCVLYVDEESLQLRDLPGEAKR